MTNERSPYFMRDALIATSKWLRPSAIKTALVISLLLIGVGCSDDDPVAPEFIPSFVAGYVKHNDPNKTPMANVEIDLVEYAWSGGYMGYEYPTGWSMSTCTNTQGYFSFRYNAAAKYGYRLEVSTTVTLQWIYAPNGTTKNLTLWIPSNEPVPPCN